MILASLVRAYERLGDKAPAEGFSTEKIGFVIPLNEDGTLAGKPIDLREGEGRKKTPSPVDVPASFKRPGITPRSFFLWDNTAYALGVSNDKDAAPRHAAFRERHLRDLTNVDDAGLLAAIMQRLDRLACSFRNFRRPGARIGAVDPLLRRGGDFNNGVWG